ncbi:hypothetical protein HNY73_014983 [Argiope bruennichi]|uniref:Uncharacterized protein n=1 Tax=Argiope bruennichi TaxID=94029 RepID=A0A8T0EQQ2_ARGBR|nr:hypothetical protein HNY73_014983 [Argiope bruennichi]
MSTHNGSAFTELIHDLLHYALPRYGLEWEEPHIRNSIKVFREEFGEAVILFRERHANEFKSRMLRISGMECPEDVFQYIALFCKSTFKGNAPLMELFIFCAFLLDLTIYCLRLYSLELYTEVIDDTSAVFDEYVQQYFTVVGGWYALYHVAAQYTSYACLLTKLNSSVFSAVGRAEADII